MGSRNKLAVLAFLAVTSSTFGREFVINSAQDNNVCNQNECDLRGAWTQAFQNPSGPQLLLLNVDPVLTKPLVGSSNRGNPVSIKIQGGGHNVSTAITISGSSSSNGPFISWTVAPPGSSLALQGVTIRDWTNKVESGTTAGGAITMTIFQSRAEGEAPTQPAFTTPTLSLSNVKFWGNTITATSKHSLAGGAVAIWGCYLQPKGCNIQLSYVDFISNVISGGFNNEGSAMWARGGGVFNATNVIVSGNQFENSETENYGAICATQFEGHFMNCIFTANTGATQLGTAVVMRNGNANFDFCTFSGNDAGFQLQKTPPGIVAGHHLHFAHCSFTNTDSRIFITSTDDDQYFKECTIFNTDGSTPTLLGFSMYLRNPILPHLKLAAVAGTLGGGTFNDCSSGQKWLPCPGASVCNNVYNGSFVTVGYNCF